MTLHIVDDEEVIRDSLALLARSREIASTCYGSGTSFLSVLDRLAGCDPQGDCVLLDVRIPDISGIVLFDLMAARDLTLRLPVIFLTGHGEVSMAVDALKRGAFDFFEKPFNGNQLMDRVKEALLASRQAHVIHARMASLSCREREVLDLILAGNLNKVIADKLQISTRTVEVHRANIFGKVNVKTAVELAGLIGAGSRK